MLHAISEWVIRFLSAVLCSLAIKLLDDYLDRELDDISGQYNWINYFGEGAIAYSLPFLAVSISLHLEIGLTLFLASWTIGMYRDLHIRFPSKLRGWHESLIGVGVGIHFAGWNIMICSLFIVSAVQLCDDVIDRCTDRVTGIRNLAHRWGVNCCGFASMMLLVSAKLIAPTLFGPIITGVIVVYIASALKRRRVHV